MKQTQSKTMTGGDMHQLLQEAHRLDVSVHMAHIEDDDELLGYFNAQTRMVVLRIGMTRTQTRCVLAHEIAHVILGHECSTGRTERQARRIAASLLINADDYARAERIESESHWIAEELNVTAEIVDDYRQFCLQRLGSRTYGRSWRVGLMPRSG